MSLELSGTTGVKGVAGSVSAPSIVGDDTNTGISFPSADTIKFSTGGVERLSITNSGLSGDGSGLSGISMGISDFDIWYLTADTVGNTSPVQNNWSRWTGHGGTGSVTFAAPSSGYWTFPSTGYWLIEWHARFQVTNAEERGCNADIYVTTDNTTYSFVTQASVNMIQNALAVKGNAVARYIFDVQNVSTHKMFVSSGYQMVSGTLTGNGSYLYSHVKLFKLKDT